MNDFDYGKNREEKIDKFLDVLAWHFSSKKVFDYTANAVDKLNGKLDALNQNLVNAGKSSDDLTKALNRITLWATIIAGLGVTVAILNFIFDNFIKK